jgi:hypothetical protein
LDYFMTIREQVLKRVAKAPKSTITRSSLADLGAYRAVSRVLRELLERGALRQVSRGVYAAPNVRDVGPVGLRQHIQQRLEASNSRVLLRQDFADLGSYDAVGRLLQERVQSGQLVKIGYGLYAKTRVSGLTGKIIPVVALPELATEALARLKRNPAVASATQEYNAGRTTQIPTGRVIAVRGRISRKIGFNGTYIQYEKRP